MANQAHPRINLKTAAVALLALGLAACSAMHRYDGNPDGTSVIPAVGTIPYDEHVKERQRYAADVATVVSTGGLLPAPGLRSAPR